MKTLKDICRQLEKEPSIGNVVSIYRYDGEIGQDILTYRTFERIMMADGFILAESTVKQKWKLLVNNGILKELPSGKAIFNVEPFAEVMGYTHYTAEKKIKKIFSEGGTAPITEGSE